MEAWILILFLKWGNSGGPLNLGAFPNFDSCMNALRQVEYAYTVQKPSWPFVDIRCVRLA
jgi:hypothetical protein